MFSRLIESICQRIRAAVYARLSAEVDAADGCGTLQIEQTTPALPAPEKRRGKA